MASKIKKVFIIGSVVSSLFMALTACNINQTSDPSHQSATSQSSPVSSDDSSYSSSSQTSSSSSSSSSASSSSSSSQSASSSSMAPIVTLDSISVSNNKNTYERGEELDIVVTANYSDGSSTTINDYQVEGYNKLSIGEQTITVSYQGKTCTSKVTVKQPTLVSIDAVSKKENYEYGEDLDIVVTANYSDGSSATISDYQITGYNEKISGSQDVLVTYEGKTYSLKVKVNDPILVSLTIEGQKDSYEYGEDLNLTVSANYSDGSSIVVTDYQVEGFNKEQPGEQNITVKYQEKTSSFKVLVKELTLTSITVSNNKENYEYCEDLDVVVTAHYSNSSSKVITDYQVEGFNKEQPGEQTVVISYEGKNCSFETVVNNPVITSITAVSNKESYEYGDDLDVIVVAHYSDGTDVTVTDYQVEGFNDEVSGVQTLTFSYEGKTCTLDVSVKERTNYFPTKQLDAYLQLENIKTTIPVPTSLTNWTNNVLKEQDGSNYFYTTTKDENDNSIANKYAALLNNEGWMVNHDENGYTATLNNGDALLTFSTSNKVFSLRIEGYCEFPDFKTIGTATTSSSSLKDGDVVIIGNVDKDFLISDFENNSFKTTEVPCTSEGPKFVSKNIWRFTLKKVGTTWNLIDIHGRKLGATGMQQLTWDEGSTEWTFLFTTKFSMISNVAKECGRLCYNPDTGKVTTYETVANTNMSYLQIFKLSQVDLIYPTNIVIDGKQEIGTGKSNKLSLKFLPENANAVDEVLWSSSNEDVATINSNGLVTGLTAGKTNITAIVKSKNGYLQASFGVDIKDIVLDSWTILLYICGSDLESGSGLASSDIGEILKVTGQPDDVNIVLETGGTTKWRKYGIDANALTRYHVENQTLVMDQKLPKENMGKQSTLESFLDWGLEEYPAEKTGVVFWNHGGALDGCCFDDYKGTDSLVNSETSRAFKNVFERNGIDKLEFVGYDCCLMQIQDVAEFNSKYFNYMVGSEEAEVGNGWKYDGWIGNVYKYDSTANILKATCDSFVASCGSGSSNDQGLSYLNLSKMANYHDKFESLAASMKTTVKGNYSSFKSLLGKVKDYGGSGWSSGLYSYGTIDGYDLLNKLRSNATYSSFQNQIDEVKAAYSELVAYSKKGAGAGQTNGLAVIGAISVSYPSSETNFTNWRSLFY